MTQVVFFDIGGTLLFDDPPVPVVFERVARRLGYDVDINELLSFMPHVDAYYQAEYRRDGDFWCDHQRAVQVWLDMYTMMAKHIGISDGADILAQAVYDEYLDPQNWSMFEDAIACLDGLRDAGMRLGVISNWDATLEKLLKSLGYARYFDDIVASAAVGYRKPNREIFDLALQRMGVGPSDAVHVGDLPDADGDGAASAGIRPILIDRHVRHQKAPYERVVSLNEIIPLVTDES